MSETTAREFTEHDPIRLLVAERVPDVCDSIQKLLYFERDIKVIAAVNSAQELLRQAQALTPDVILLDGFVPLSDIDGFQALELLFEMMPVRVVLSFLVWEPEYRERAKTLGIGPEQWLIYPLSGNYLAEMVRRVARMPPHCC